MSRLMLSVDSGETKNVRREKLKDSMPRNGSHSHWYTATLETQIWFLGWDDPLEKG